MQWVICTMGQYSAASLGQLPPTWIPYAFPMLHLWYFTNIMAQVGAFAKSSIHCFEEDISKQIDARNHVTLYSQLLPREPLFAHQSHMLHLLACMVIKHLDGGDYIGYIQICENHFNLELCCVIYPSCRFGWKLLLFLSCVFSITILIQQNPGKSRKYLNFN